MSPSPLVRHGIRPARHSAPRLSPSVAYGPDSSLMPLRRAPHRPDLRVWWALKPLILQMWWAFDRLIFRVPPVFDPSDPANGVAFGLRPSTKLAAVDAGVGGAAASRVNAGPRPRRRTAAEPSTPASAAREHLTLTLALTAKPKPNLNSNLFPALKRDQISPHVP